MQFHFHANQQWFRAKPRFETEAQGKPGAGKRGRGRRLLKFS